MKPHLPGFEGLVWIGQQADSSLWRAVRTSDNFAVLLKSLTVQPTAARKETFRRQYHLLSSLNVPGLLRPLEYLDNSGAPVMVLEPFRGETLESRLEPSAADPTYCVRVTWRLAEVLEVLHGAGYVHNDIRPLNVLEADGEVRLCDCGRVTPEGEGVFSPEDLPEGEIDWAYLSPEMTGRMNRNVDYRTDLYSLGVLMYRLTTGRLPFQAADPLEWVHAHLALHPPPPATVAPSVPTIISDIVMKLMAKQPEERYQSARGLRMDLQRFIEESGEAAPFPVFPLARHDHFVRLNFSGRLYGRDTERARLLSSMGNVAATGDTEFFLVRGPAGVGKSALVSELSAEITRTGATLLAGRFEQLRQDIPYATLGDAFQESIRTILSRSQQELEEWRRRLRDGLGVDGPVLFGVIPRLALILGPQPPLPEVAPEEAPKRFNRVFQRLLAVFAGVAHPVALVLDDLQWADAASLHLLESLLTDPDQRYLMVVGAYRDNEDGSQHPLSLMLERLRRRQRAFEELRLLPLSQVEVGQLLMEVLHCPSPDQIAPLAAVILRKTAGNPFFVQQFVGWLHREGLVAFDRGSSSWRWNLERIGAEGFTDNVLELLAGMLTRLPEQTLELMKVMACLGNSVDVRILEWFWRDASTAPLDVRGESIFTSLGYALREGLLVRSGPTMRFLHDRVREAAYALIPEEQRAERHLCLGRLLRDAWSSPQQRDENLFVIVSQLNLGSLLLTDVSEKVDVARLNLLAGRKAKSSGAYASAASYLSVGAALLPAAAWASDYELAFSLNLAWGECAYLSGDLEGAKARLTELLERTRTRTDQVAVYRVLISTYLTAGENDGARSMALAGLNRYGISIPPHPTRLDALSEYGEVKRLLGDTEVEELLRRPALSNPDTGAAIDLLALLPVPQMTKDPNLAFLACARIVLLSLRDGNSAAAAKGYSMFGLEMLGFEADYAMAHRFAKLGHDLASQAGYIPQLPATGLALAVVSFWMRPFAEVEEIAAAAQTSAVQVDDMMSGCFAAHYLCALKLLDGRSLEDALQELRRQLGFIKKANYKGVADSVQNVEFCILKLTGTPPAQRPPGQQADSGKRSAHAGKPDHAAVIFDIYLLMSDCILGDHRAALEAADRAGRGIAFRVGKADYFTYQFYRGLAAAAVYPDAPPDEKAALLAVVEASHAELELWAESCPQNFRAAFCLIAAERARVADQFFEAARLYEEGLRAARDNGFLQHMGLAHELAARLYRGRSLDRLAGFELRSARACYLRWGALGKVRRLDAEFPILLGSATSAGEFSSTPLLDRVGETASTTSADGSHRLDFLAVLKASQALSGEIVLQRLLEILMRTVLESSGAQEGALVLVRGEKMHLAAGAKVEGSHVVVRLPAQSASPELSPMSHLLPASILNYVHRTGERVLLADATSPGPFSTDPFLALHRPKSVLCLPILRRAGPVAFLYLHNALVSDAFTPSRLATLELLASQAAIALENAILYDNLQHENTERKRAEAELRGSQQLLQNIIDSSSAVIYVKDLQGAFLLVNRVFERIFKVTPGTVAGKTDFDLFPEERAQILRAADRRVLETGNATASEDRIDQEDGEHSYFSVRNPLFDQTGGIFAVCCISTDITDSKRIEEQLRQSQKLEAVGHLAGGIAHDFNNLLTAINGYSWLASREAKQSEPLNEYLDEIRKAGERAAALTRQLLAYSRKQLLEPKVWDLNVIVADMEKMLRRLISEDINLVTSLGPDVGLVKVDRGQVEQILVNLVVNARDAMPEGGRLTVRTMRVVSPSGTATVMLEIGDTGSGMSPEVQSRIFEPYFTTKEAGKGTGLGLSVVYGIVKQSGASLEFQSEPGIGTSFRIYFPASSHLEGVVGQLPPQIAAEQYRGTETLLLVEDDDSVRSFVAKILEGQGYTMLAASNGREAIRTLEEAGARIALVITDVVMPDMGGIALSSSLKERFPAIPLLFLSGYSEALGWHDAMESEGRAFLQKPFSPSTLLQKVHRLLRAGTKDKFRY